MACEFIDFFLERSQEKYGCCKCGWSPDLLCSFSVLALVSVLLISNRMSRCSLRSRRWSKGCYMQTLNRGGSGCWVCSGGITFFSHAHFRLDALVPRSRNACSHSNSYCKTILWPSCNAWSKQKKASCDDWSQFDGDKHWTAGVISGETGQPLF